MFHNVSLQSLSVLEYRIMPVHIRHVPQARKGQEDDLRYRGSNDKVSDIRHQVYANDGFLSKVRRWCASFKCCSSNSFSKVSP